MTNYNYYIDKRKYNKNTNNVDIVLDYPIEIEEWQYLKVKLVDFKFLNNIYNISGYLSNNQFNIRRTGKVYTYTQTYPDYVFDTNFFVYYNTNTLLVPEVIDTTENSSSITYQNLTIKYFSPSITDDTQSYMQNVFNGGNMSRNMSFNRPNEYFEFINTDGTRIISLIVRLAKTTYTAPLVGFDIEIKFQRFNTTTNAFEDIDTQSVTFPCYTAIEDVATTLTYTNPVDTNRYRVITTTENVPFDIYARALLGKRQNLIFDNGTIQYAVQDTLTLTDGFYKASTLKTSLDTLLSPYNITTSIDSYTNKLKLTNNNSFSLDENNLNDSNFKIQLVMPDIENMKENWGITDSYQEYIHIPTNSYYEGDTNINLINLSKLIITTDLNFTNKTHNDLIKGNNNTRGIGNILEWVNCDDIPYSCIKYHNYDDLCYKIENKFIGNIRLSFYNEKCQSINLDNALLHLQIKKLNKKSY